MDKSYQEARFGISKTLFQDRDTKASLLMEIITLIKSMRLSSISQIMRAIWRTHHIDRRDSRESIL